MAGALQQILATLGQGGALETSRVANEQEGPANVGDIIIEADPNRKTQITPTPILSGEAAQVQKAGQFAPQNVIFGGGSPFPVDNRSQRLRNALVLASRILQTVGGKGGGGGQSSP